MPVLSDTRERVINDLIDAHNCQQLVPLSADYPPFSSREDSYFIQDQVVKSLQSEPIKAWKVGAAASDQEPYCAPILSQRIFPSGACLNNQHFHDRGMESELCFVLANDLPPQNAPYSLHDLAAAIGTVEVVMELVDSRLEEWQTRDPFLKLADNQMNGALIVGDSLAVNNWAPLNFSRLQAELFINGSIVATGRHVLGDPIGCLSWLANHLAKRQGGLRRGDRIITGSWTGMKFVEAGDKVRARFKGVGQVEISL